MKAVLAIVASALALVLAEPPAPQQYSAPLIGLLSGPSSNYGAPQESYGAPAPSYGAPAEPAPGPSYGAPAEPSQQYGAAPPPQYGPPSGPTVHKHVYIHSAPDEVAYPESKVIRVGGKQEKHVNIIFVKAPSSSSNSQTEVILPEQPQQKTLVYARAVLVKKAEASNNVRVSGPQPTKPPKPEVYFIRYKGNEGGYGAPAPQPAPQYGAPTPNTSGGYN